MDQTTAKRLFREGAFFIFLDVPPGTEFGIDMKSWTTGEKFRGVKMIPPGIHFIFYNSVSSTDDVAPRIGIFHNFKKGEVFARKWDRETEQMSNEDVSDSEIVSLKENILSLDEFLGPYPYDILDKWKGLSSNITNNLLQHLTPLSGQIKSALELESCSDKDRPRGGQAVAKRQRLSGGAEDLLPVLKPVEGTDLRFTKFPERSYPEGASPSQITQHSLDLTFSFETILKKYSQPIEIIGEIEFCFICFLVGHSLEAFDQWKKLVTLFCSCDVAVTRYRRLFDAFISLIELHVKEIPQEFLADIVSNNNFVYTNLRNLFRTIRGSNLDGQLKTKADRFRKDLTSTYFWDFEHLESDSEDEAPVVVEIET